MIIPQPNSWDRKETNEFNQEFDKLFRESRDLVTAQRAQEREIVERHRALMRRCPHKHTDYHPDASGNNDSWTECLDCGAQL